ncbi:hypothetical protein ANN_24406 [Periplaneta americana]|uniref:Uncharacterized protein n=1 Tax=Periplaneta americana TaxID=6978 RepID=A0ABQ8S3D1_PERAM|nr:hypothetical protein ANN_24406 [Periplaneta americana]
MAGLFEGGNEPPGSLKPSVSNHHHHHRRRRREYKIILFVSPMNLFQEEKYEHYNYCRHDFVVHSLQQIPMVATYFTNFNVQTDYLVLTAQRRERGEVIGGVGRVPE